MNQETERKEINAVYDRMKEIVMTFPDEKLAEVASIVRGMFLPVDPMKEIKKLRKPFISLDNKPLTPHFDGGPCWDWKP